MDDIYKNKYLKYKTKYLSLKEIIDSEEGGKRKKIKKPKIKMPRIEKNRNIDFFLNFNEVKENILTNFSNFKNFDLIQDKIEKVSKGKNGITNNIIFSKVIKENKEKINILLKTPISLDSDNNYYEYVNGLCINKFKKYFPNFAYTFGYGDINPIFIDEIEKEPYENIEPDFFRKNFTSFNDNDKEERIMGLININEGCKLNSQTSILTENIPNSKTLYSYITNPEFIKPENINYNIFCVLFQIYIALSSLSDEFTHYDLHEYNVLISEYEKPIILNYKLRNGTDVTLCTKYIPVMIDYGRCYVNCLNYRSIINSTNFLNTACYTKDCLDDGRTYSNCFLKNGLYLRRKGEDNYDKYNEWFHNITPHKKNKSYDLSLLNRFMTYFRSAKTEIKGYYNSVFNQIKNPEWFKSDGSLRNGVIEQNVEFKENHIKTVYDCFYFFTSVYIKFHYETKILDETLCLGKMTIYEDMSVPWSFTKF